MREAKTADAFEQEFDDLIVAVELEDTSADTTHLIVNPDPASSEARFPASDIRAFYAVGNADDIETIDALG